MDTLSVVTTVDYSRHEEVRLLFDETIAKFQKSGNSRFREQQIFTQVLGDTQETSEIFLRFLHDVSTCPPEVIRWCQKQINVSARLRLVK